MSAWYYNKGRLEQIDTEHPEVADSVANGKARIRYHDSGVLAVQARSLHLCRQALAAVLDSIQIRPARINAEWPGHFVDCQIHEWK